MKRHTPSIDWTDRDTLRRWFADLSTAIDDASAVTADMLLPLRKRTLGPAEARRLHREADEAIRALLDAGERGLVTGSRAKRIPLAMLRYPPELLKPAEPPRTKARRGAGVFEARYARLLERRVPVEKIEVGKVYLVHARNGGVGVAVREDGRLGYCLHREKWGEHYLFTEYDWAEGPPFGTAIPLRALDDAPPEDEAELLAWLAEREVEHKDEIQAAWKVILGNRFPEAPPEG